MVVSSVNLMRLVLELEVQPWVVELCLINVLEKIFQNIAGVSTLT